LLFYCLGAALAPVWSLLQPRGELGGYFLYLVMIASVVGVLVGALTGQEQIAINQPFFKGWQSEAATASLGYAAPLFPILFITVACGACSGFHSIVASGTTSKQLKREIDAKPVAYGGMLLEGFFACISLGTVMILADAAGGPSAIYAGGIREFAYSIIRPLAGAHEAIYGAIYQFALLCFATFVFDTLDACTRLARYILMELLGWTTRAQAGIATVMCLAFPAITLSLPPVEFAGQPQPLWKVFWNIFGSSNQLLAALTLLGVSVWLAKKSMPFWLALAPAIFMMGMTLWSLVLFIPPYIKLFQDNIEIEIFSHVQFVITVSLIVMSLWLIVEAILTWQAMIKPPQNAPSGEPVQA
jgi:carbon starvation protein